MEGTQQVNSFLFEQKAGTVRCIIVKHEGPNAKQQQEKN